MKITLKKPPTLYYILIIYLLSINISLNNADAASTITIVTKKIGINNLNVLVSNLLRFVLSIAGGVALIMLIVGGIKYMTANGDEQKISGAKKTLLWAIFGLILVLLAYVISSVIYKIFL
ncbi:MAG: pilin [Minisyncoccia bacterium]